MEIGDKVRINSELEEVNGIEGILEDLRYYPQHEAIIATVLYSIQDGKVQLRMGVPEDQLELIE